MPLPEKDEMFMTKGQMLQEIMVSLGGRIAEELIFGDVTTGATQDIKQATSIAKAMVTQYGMSEEIGLVDYGDDDEVFIGRDFGHTKGYSDDVAKKIDDEIKRIVDECYVKARDIILAHQDILEKSAELLLEKEKIGRLEFESLFGEDERAENLPDEDIVVAAIEEVEEEKAAAERAEEAQKEQAAGENTEEAQEEKETEEQEQPGEKSPEEPSEDEEQENE